MLGATMAFMMMIGAQGEQAVGSSTEHLALNQPEVIDQMLDRATADVRLGRNAEALAYLDPMAASITELVKREERPVFCAHSEHEANNYRMRVTANSPAAQFMPARLCNVLFMRAYVLINLRRLAEAREQLSKLVALGPDFPHYQVEYGSALREAGELDAALKVYRRAVELSAPVKEYAFDQAAALRGIGFILTEQGDLDGAEKAYRQSLELAPGHPVALHEVVYIAQVRAKGVKAPPTTIESSINPATFPAQSKERRR